MARIRSVKPELRDSKLVASWPIDARFFWVLFWGYLDDSGRGLDLPKRIAGDTFPHDDYDAQDIDRWLTMMGTGLAGNEGPVCRYTVKGTAYVHCVNWSEHQRPNRPTPSRLPPCPVHESLTESLNGHAVPGAAEQRSRGAGEQQQARRESVTAHNTTVQVSAAAEFVIQTLQATPDEAASIVMRIQKTRSPTNLPGLLRTMAKAGDLEQFLHDARKDAKRRDRTRILADARKAPPCPHNINGGDLPHPDSGEPICAQCRRMTAQTEMADA